MNFSANFSANSYRNAGFSPKFAVRFTPKFSNSDLLGHALSRDRGLAAQDERRRSTELLNWKASGRVELAHLRIQRAEIIEIANSDQATRDEVKESGQPLPHVK